MWGGYLIYEDDYGYENGDVEDPHLISEKISRGQVCVSELAVDLLTLGAFPRSRTTFKKWYWFTIIIMILWNWPKYDVCIIIMHEKKSDLQ